MPLAYRIVKKKDVVITRGSGVVTDEDVITLKSLLVHDPDFREGMCELSDLRSVKRLNVTVEGIRSMVLHDAHHGARVASHRLAIVASDDFTFGMGRLYQTRTEQNIECVRVFRNIRQAKEWLGLC